jgi:ATP-dependent Lhr-like helicase
VQTVSETEWRAALAQQLLSRYGLVTRDVAAAESIPGGFSAVYDVLRSLEERGRIRRGFFVSGVGATQFALAPALDLLRSVRQPGDEVESIVLAASDPANPFGTVLAWPSDPAPREADEERGARRTPSRMVGARVVIVDGRLAAWVSRGGRQILTWLPEVEPDRSRIGQAVAQALAGFAREGEGREGGLLVGEVDGVAATDHPIAPFLENAGFVRSALGYQVRRETQARRAEADG